MKSIISSQRKIYNNSNQSFKYSNSVLSHNKQLNKTSDTISSFQQEPNIIKGEFSVSLSHNKNNIRNNYYHHRHTKTFNDNSVENYLMQSKDYENNSEEFFDYEDFLCDRLEKYQDELKSLKTEIRKLGKKQILDPVISGRINIHCSNKKRRKMLNTSAKSCIREAKTENVVRMNKTTRNRLFRIRTHKKQNLKISDFLNQTRNEIMSSPLENKKNEPKFAKKGHTVVFNSINIKTNLKNENEEIFQKIAERRKEISQKERNQRNSFFKQKLRKILEHFDPVNESFNNPKLFSQNLDLN